MCGFLKKFIKTGIGLAGKHLMNFANSATGGLAGKIVNTAIDGVNKHAGVIGKVAQGIGQKLFSDKTREKISNFVDKAIKFIPKGNVRTALEKVNNAAQGRNENYNIKTKINKQLNSTEWAQGTPKTKSERTYCPKERCSEPNSQARFVKGGG